MSSECNTFTKRKHKTISIQEKVQLLKLLEAGTPVRRLCDIFSVGSSTVYDIKRKKADLLKFYDERQSKKGVAVRKTMKAGKCNDLELALVEWFGQRKIDGITVTGGMLIDQAKKFHKDFKLNFHCKYSNGWLDKFKNRHGIKLYTVDDDELASDCEEGGIPTEGCTNTLTDQELVIPNECDAVESFIEKFADLVISEDLHPEQVYNASQTTLFWRQLPEEIFSAKENGNRCCNMQDSNERMAVFSCSNAAGTHRCKLLVVGKSPRPKAFNGVKVLPVVFRANERNCITSEILLDWFENTFVPEAKMHCARLGLNQDCKVLLILDDGLTPSNCELLVKDSVHVIFFPTTCATHIQPQSQGIIQRLKYCYRLECLTYVLGAVCQGKPVKTVFNEFTLKNSAWALARAWENVLDSTLRHSWNKLWPSLMYEDNTEPERVVADTYKDYKRQTLNMMLECAENTNFGLPKSVSYENLEEWIDAGDEISFKNSQATQMPITHDSVKEEIVDEAEMKDKSIETCISLASELMSGLEQHGFVTEDEIMFLYRLKANLIAERLKAKHVEESICTVTKKKEGEPFTK